MGINVISNTQSQELTLAASAAITAGDLILQNEGGQVYKATSQLTLAQQNVTTAGPSAMSAYASLFGTGYRTHSMGYESIVHLGDGRIAIANSGNGTTGTTGVNVFFISQAGGALSSRLQVVSTAGITGVRLKKINDSSFIVVWNVGGILRFATYNNDGTNVIAATTVSSSLSGGGNDIWNFNLLTNGDFVFAYRKVTSADLVFSRYNSSGVLQGTETTVEATSSPQYISVLAHSSGDFWVYYSRTAATTANKFARYNNSGTLQGSLTSVLTSNAGFASNFWAQISELGNGNVLMFAADGSGWPNAYVYNSSGTLVASNTTWHGSVVASTVQNFSPFALVESNTATIFTINSSSVLNLWRIDNSLNFLTEKITGGAVATLTQTGTGAYLRVFSEGSAGYFVFSAGFNGTSYTSDIASVNLSGTLIGSKINLFSSAGAIYDVQAIKTAQGNIVLNASTDTTNTRGGVYSPSRKNIIGVAQASAASGATFRCATVGTYTLTAATVPSSPGSFDNRTATPGGARGNVSGTTAILNGLV